MSSRGVIDLRKRSAGAPSRGGMRSLMFNEAPKRETLRSKRKKRRLVKLAILVVLLLGGGYGLSYASHTPRFTVQNIEVKGVKELSAEALRAHAEGVIAKGGSQFFSGANIFTYPEEEVERLLKENFSRLESAEASRESLFATTVVISVRERESFARWCGASSQDFTEIPVEVCYMMDRDGYVFAPVEATSTPFVSPYVFRGGLSATTSVVGQTYLPGTFSSLLALLDRLGQAQFTPKEVSVEGGDFSVSLGQGFDLRASLGVNVAQLLRDLDTLLSSSSLRDKQHELEYIDFRFGNRVYYKPKGEAATSDQ